LITNTEEESLVLVKRVENEEVVEPYLDIQRTYQHKKQTMTKMIEYMKKRSAKLKDRIHENQVKLKEMTSYCQASNPVVMKREAAANDMMLNIYNPLYFNRKDDQDQYLIPVKDFEKEIEERTKKRRLYFDVVLNMRTVRRVIVSTSDLLHKKYSDDDHKITRDLMALGELKIFEKLKGIFGGSGDSISIMEINNLVNFKLVASENLETNINRSDNFYFLLVIYP
jgi:hypothetical protein